MDTQVRYYYMRMGNVTFSYAVNQTNPELSDYYYDVAGGLKTYGPFETMDTASEHYQFMYRIGKQEDILAKQGKIGIMTEERENNVIEVDFLNRKKRV